MSPRALRRSTEAELDALERVCERLSGFGEPVDQEWADGFLTALVTGPVRPPEERWLEALAGDAFERAYADPPDRAQALAALAARIAAIETALDADALAEQPDALRLDPLMMEVTDEDRARAVAEGALDAEQAAQLQTGALWAQGFLDAEAAFAAVWQAPAEGKPGADEYLDLVSQVHALLIPPGSDDARTFASIDAPEDLPARDELVTEALFAVQDLRLWWLDHAPRPERGRVAPQPGRNDPCPCGSGKKFKKCHGAQA